uniref:Uncharacterized protein n=1 Tax=Anguilla anguilla TaxID=7936 RepID=A0A0E9XB86_ANGAN
MHFFGCSKTETGLDSFLIPHFCNPGIPTDSYPEFHFAYVIVSASGLRAFKERVISFILGALGLY